MPGLSSSEHRVKAGKVRDWMATIKENEDLMSVGAYVPGSNARVDEAFAKADKVIEGEYGIPVITHCCLESHGSVALWDKPDHLDFQVSTQNVSGIASQMAEPLGIPASEIPLCATGKGYLLIYLPY